jgi:hypothetical protein
MSVESPWPNRRVNRTARKLRSRVAFSLDGEAARALVNFLRTPKAAVAITTRGLEAAFP